MGRGGCVTSSDPSTGINNNNNNKAVITSTDALIALYSSDRTVDLTGAAVLDAEGYLVGVVSPIPYKRATQSAYWVTSLLQIACDVAKISN